MKVFISSHHGDVELADELGEYLRQHGITPWLPTTSLVAGMKVSDAIDEAIRTSDAFILLMTPGWAESTWAQAELASALALKNQAGGSVKVIPVLAGDVDVPPLLHDYRWVDLRKAADRQQAFALIVEGLEHTGSPDAKSTIDDDASRFEQSLLALVDANRRFGERQQLRLMQVMMAITASMSTIAAAIVAVTQSSIALLVFAAPVLAILATSIGFYLGRRTAQDG